MRRLSPDEAALWARVMASVRPLQPPMPERAKPVPPPAAEPPPAPVPTPRAPKGRVPPVRALPEPRRAAPPITARTLDASWDRRLMRGLADPDMTVDLHGHTLSTAHALLDVALARSITRGDRLLLLVTGKPPRPESERPHARGAIRAAVADWLAASRHADAIAAVRPAAPRHGGAGALYIVLRRRGGEG